MHTAQQFTPNAVLGPRGLQIAAGEAVDQFRRVWDGDLLRELLDGTTISKWDWNAGATTNILSPSRPCVEQRHESDARPERRHPRRLARRSDLARVRQHRASHLCDDDPDHASLLYADARSPIPCRDRLAERRLQSAAASELLPRRRHVPAARRQHRHLPSTCCSDRPRQCSRRSSTTPAPRPRISSRVTRRSKSAARRSPAPPSP